MTFVLSFDKHLEAKAAVMGKLEVLDKEARGVSDLEPVLGAFAHIVGFYESGSGVAHIHPMGEEPETDKDRGASPLSFHIEPSRPGFLKLWAQLRISGMDLFIPFGVEVTK